MFKLFTRFHSSDIQYLIHKWNYLKNKSLHHSNDNFQLTNIKNDLNLIQQIYKFKLEDESILKLRINKCKNKLIEFEQNENKL